MGKQSVKGIIRVGRREEGPSGAGRRSVGGERAECAGWSGAGPSESPAGAGRPGEKGQMRSEAGGLT